ncbi:MAG: pirin family protein [Planctomycetes bacterium]|nr:pirin family protein [Planctomycetota bacterium]MBI3836272.1 pirin family protein [Planctomycetota bacterium]
MKKIIRIETGAAPHWVGDGFPVRTIFSYQNAGEVISPFLLLDYAGPARFEPTDNPRGVEEHPHRGFETVTIVYQGQLEHRDSAGNHGTIGPGDVQWMTAASGVVHEEFHQSEFTRNGGILEMVQLWVNLPAKFKMSAPKYQTLLDRDIPVVSIPNGCGTVRVIAGEFQGLKGPACTFSPIDLWDLRLAHGARTELSLPEGHNTALLVLRGRLRLNASKVAGDAELALFDRTGGTITVEAQSNTSVLVLSGEPISEPIVGRGPFVMNTEEEICQAILDYQHGRIGRIGL